MGKALRLVRRRYGPDIYYNDLKLITRDVHRDLIRHLSNRDGNILEDMIMVSLHIYDDVCAGDIDMKPNLYLQYLFDLPSLILSKYCKMVEIRREENFLSCTIIYKGVTYHVSMATLSGEEKEIQGITVPAYIYDSGEYVCYKSLLHIIIYYFVWTYDREDILNRIRGEGPFTERIENSSDVDPVLRLLVSVEGM